MNILHESLVVRCVLVVDQTLPFRIATRWFVRGKCARDVIKPILVLLHGVVSSRGFRRGERKKKAIADSVACKK